MLTVPEAAARTGKNAETIRRWIRSGRLRAAKIGTQHVIDEADLTEAMGQDETVLPLPPGWGVMSDGTPMPDVVAVLARSRAGR